jgi:hypothetical protein
VEGRNSVGSVVDGLVRETANEVIPAGEAEWREGIVWVATKVLTSTTLGRLRFTSLVKMCAMST